ncbi:MAG: pyridoxamine 5'-phosphate oxidase family protein [Chloroflexota bacterium]
MDTDLHTATHQPAVTAFLAGAHIARLATCSPQTGQPHVVPVWYQWDGEGLWISSFRSTRKVKELRLNPRFSLAIDTAQPGEPVRGVIFEGRVELIEDHQEAARRGFLVYARYLGEAGARAEEPQSWLNDPEHLLIHCLPEKVHVFGL